MDVISNSISLFIFILFADDTNLFATIEYKLSVEIANVDDLANKELE